MIVESLRIGMRVRHPAYGVGMITALTEHTADIRFDDGGIRTVSPDGSALQPMEATAEISGASMPLAQLIRQTVDATVASLGLEKPEKVTVELGQRWHGGRLVMHPADPSLQAKEVPMETFFHKIVMMRNQLRVLEQKINGHDTLTDADKVELQQYITRCYGSMTTFNILFREKEAGF
jgi:hypothetical protein